MDFLERSQAYVPLVIHEWGAHAQGREPWKAMPLDDLLGELPAVTAALLEEVGNRESGSEVRNATVLEEAARRHGAFRRRQGCAVTVLSDDYEVLRRAIRSTLRTSGIPVNRMAGVLYETLVALRLAARASTREFSIAAPPPATGLEPEQGGSRPEEP